MYVYITWENKNMSHNATHMARNKSKFTTHQHNNTDNNFCKTQRTASTEDVAFLFFFYPIANENENVRNGSYFYFRFFICELGERERETWLYFSFFLVWNKK